MWLFSEQSERSEKKVLSIILKAGESNGARTTAFIPQSVGLQVINIERYEVCTEFLRPQIFRSLLKLSLNVNVETGRK